MKNNIFESFSDFLNKSLNEHSVYKKVKFTKATYNKEPMTDDQITEYLGLVGFPTDFKGDVEMSVYDNVFNLYTKIFHISHYMNGVTGNLINFSIEGKFTQKTADAITSIFNNLKNNNNGIKFIHTSSWHGRQQTLNLLKMGASLVDDSLNRKFVSETIEAYNATFGTNIETIYEILTDDDSIAWFEGWESNWNLNFIFDLSKPLNSDYKFNLPLKQRQRKDWNELKSLMFVKKK